MSWYGLAHSCTGQNSPTRFTSLTSFQDALGIRSNPFSRNWPFQQRPHRLDPQPAISDQRNLPTTEETVFRFHQQPDFSTRLPGTQNAILSQFSSGSPRRVQMDRLRGVD